MLTRLVARGACVLALIIGMDAAVATATAHASGCANVPASAIDQYCEMTPTATGGSVPSAGGRSLIATLPAAQGRKLLRTPAGRRLADLPAARRISSKPLATASTGRTADVSTLSLSQPLIAVLAAVALGLIALATVERWRRRSRS